LLLSLGSYKKIQQQLKAILSNLRAETTLQPGYIGGNILNLLVQMQTDLSGYDFSYLIINQAYLQDANLYEVNFAYCHFYTRYLPSLSAEFWRSSLVPTVNC
jgi:uncharacterized protein YjbI with pentapeptide repeats